jgi:hypothetical protein
MASLRESRRKKYDGQLFKYAKISITVKKVSFYFGVGKRWIIVCKINC